MKGKFANNTHTHTQTLDIIIITINYGCTSNYCPFGDVTKLDKRIKARLVLTVLQTNW